MYGLLFKTNLKLLPLHHQLDHSALKLRRSVEYQRRPEADMNCRNYVSRIAIENPVLLHEEHHDPISILQPRT